MDDVVVQVLIQAREHGTGERQQAGWGHNYQGLENNGTCQSTAKASHCKKSSPPAAALFLVYSNDLRKSRSLEQWP